MPTFAGGVIPAHGVAGAGARTCARGRFRTIGDFGLIDRETRVWEKTVYAAGGTVSATTVFALNALIRSLKGQGIWQKLGLFWPCAGNQLAAGLVAMTPLGGSASLTNTNFVSGDYAEATGLQGNGTSKRLDTGYVPSTLTGSLGVYMRDAISSGTVDAIGCRDAGNTQLYRLHYPATAVQGAWGQTTSANFTGTMSAGLWSVSRTGATALATYFNGASQGTASASVTPASPSQSLYLFAMNAGGSAASFYSGHLAGAYVALQGLSATQMLALYNAIQTFQTALGRNV